ncbi:MAG TPA: DegV family protein [Tissierellaceae bacterium]|nr:DegV family protein [Tissierellaceae bacterium]
MNIKILSDSACDLPQELIDKYDIDILPLIVTKDGKEYLEEIDISSDEVYKGMRNGEVYKTAQIPANTFQNKFEEYAKSGRKVIYLAFSSGLSGTYQTSLLVKDNVMEQYPDLDLEIIDTKAASGGFGSIVLRVAKLAKEGKSKKELIDAANLYINTIRHIFTVDNIEYLFRGGRVTRTQAFIGGILNIKPILHVDEKGKLVPLEKVRGKSKLLKRMLQLIEEETKGVNLKDQTIIITHGDDLKTASKMKELIKEKFGVEKFIINTIGATIGAHSGPGTLAVYFYNQ